MRALHAGDDDLHPQETDDPWYTETLWFPFSDPETRRCGTLYLLTRPAIGVSSLAVFWFDEGAWRPWELPYYRYLPHLPAVSSLRSVDIDLGDVTFRSRTIEPLQRYEVSYQDKGSFSVDLEVTGVLPPHGTPAMRVDQSVLTPSPDAEPRHLDQIISVQGEVVLGGERQAISCLHLRDRSWSHRSDVAPRRSGYTFGVGAGPVGFQAICQGTVGDAAQSLYEGFILRDGEVVELRSGIRRVLERSSDGYPLRLSIEGTDVTGRSFTAIGSCHSRTVFLTGIFAFDSFVEWDLDGTVVWGEDHDIWSPAAFRKHRNS